MIRGWAIVSGVLGVLAAAAGVAGLVAKPDAVVWATAPIGHSVVVIPPQVMAMEGVQEIVVDADSPMETLMGRPSDAYAWIRGESSAVVRGVSSWETVDLLAPGLYRNEGDDPSPDIWRRSYTSIGASTLRPGDYPAGLVVIIASQDRAALGTVTIELTRDPGFAWAWPAISAGALLAAVSLVLFALLWLDLRPSRAAESAAKKAKAGEKVPRERKPKEKTPQEKKPKENTPRKRTPRKTTTEPEETDTTTTRATDDETGDDA